MFRNQKNPIPKGWDVFEALARRVVSAEDGQSASTSGARLGSGDSGGDGSSSDVELLRRWRQGLLTAGNH